MLSGDFTLEQVGKKYGFSRERARQIFKVYTGLNFRARMEKAKQARELDKVRHLNSMKMHCQHCGVRILYKNGGSRKKKYCTACGILNRAKELNLKVTKNCQYCGKEFHPKRTVGKNKNWGRFCSVKCWAKVRTGVPRGQWKGAR